MIGWIKNLISPDETRDWPEVRPTALTLDFTRQSLNGVRLGDPTDRLKLLGKPRFGKTGDIRYYDYPTMGVQVCANGRGIVTFGIALGPVEPSIPPAQSVTVTFQSRSVVLKQGALLKSVVDGLGISLKEARDEDDLTATMTSGDVEVSIECTLEGRVQWIEMYRDQG